MSQEATTASMKEVLDITNTYKVKGQVFTRKQRVSSFITKHPEGSYIIETREGNATITNGVIEYGKVSTKSLVEKAFIKE